MPSERAGDIRRRPATTEREVSAEEAGRPLAAVPATAPVTAVVRGDEVLRFDDPRAAELQAGDRLVCLCSNAA